MKNPPYEQIIPVLRQIEPGYNDKTDEEIINQIDAIYSCDYVFENKRKGAAFLNNKTKLYLNIKGLHYYTPESIVDTYEKVWSKSSYEETSVRDAGSQFLIYMVKSLRALVVALTSFLFLLIDFEYSIYIIYFLFLRSIYFLAIGLYYKRKSNF
ncbi:hypothetical protein N8203_01750 [Crocinitomicaceae bacterium]|nr:hypothetical protein [Crocinitomicaceae bacterium]